MTTEMNYRPRREMPEWLKAALAVVAGTLVLLALLLVTILSIRAVGRYNAERAASTRVKVAEREVSRQQALVLVEQEKAKVRAAEALGIRSAQDEINATLTPLYVQHEYVQAILEIARSGSNSSVIYIPVGPDGIPIVETTPDAATG
jgi:hypothetical protein